MDKPLKRRRSETARAAIIAVILEMTESIGVEFFDTVSEAGKLYGSRPRRQPAKRQP